MKPTINFLANITKRIKRVEKLVLPPPPDHDYPFISKYELKSVERTNEIFKKQGRK